MLVCKCLFHCLTCLLIYLKYVIMRGLSRCSNGKEYACQCRRHRRHGFSTWVELIPWGRKWQPTPVFLPGKFYGERSLVVYSPWGCKESDMTDWLSEHTCNHLNNKNKIFYIKKHVLDQLCETPLSESKTSQFLVLDSAAFRCTLSSDIQRLFLSLWQFMSLLDFCHNILILFESCIFRAS